MFAKASLNLFMLDQGAVEDLQENFVGDQKMIQAKTYATGEAYLPIPP